MTENDTKPNEKATIDAFNRQIRNQRDLRRVRVTSATSRDDLNNALRRAAGRGPQPEEESQTFPWRSLTSGEGDA